MPDPTPRRLLEGHVLTVVGRLELADGARARRAVEATGGVCLDVAHLTAEPLEAMQLLVGGPVNPPIVETRVKMAVGERAGCALRPARLAAAVPGLWVMDVDSTLIEQEVIDELARMAGRYDEVAVITQRAMNGELDFESALRARCAVLAGLSESVFVDVRPRLRLRPGARRLIRALRAVGCRTGVVSGGFIQTVGPMAKELGIDHVEANELEISNGALTGGLAGPIVDGNRKLSFFRELTQELALPIERTVAVGDGANDLPMLDAAGLGIAFCPKPRVREKASVSVDLERLDATAHHLGWSTADLEMLAGEADGQLRRGAPKTAT